MIATYYIYHETRDKHDNDNDDCYAEEETRGHVEERQLPPGQIHSWRAQDIAVFDHIFDPIIRRVNGTHRLIEESSRQIPNGLPKKKKEKRKEKRTWQRTFDSDPEKTPINNAKIKSFN